MLSRGGTRAVVAVLVIGLGLALAPVGFQMFTRAPRGGEMLDDFRPYMNDRTITDFRGYITSIRAAEEESRAEVLPVAEEAGVEVPAQVERWHEQWSAIDTEMSDMLDDIDDSLGEYRAVDALPPFALFPYFFLLPGLIGAGLAVWALRTHRPHRALAVTAALGVGLIAAPAVFQMFTRAPEGKEMIDTFRPLMTQEKVTRIQGHFITIGAAEGRLRNRVLPDLEEAAAGADGVDIPELEQIDGFVGVWPTMSNDMAPMIGAMADNLTAFEGIDALPPFSLFPWFFVLPGVLVIGLAVFARSTTDLATIKMEPPPRERLDPPAGDTGPSSTESTDTSRSSP